MKSNHFRISFIIVRKIKDSLCTRRVWIALLFFTAISIIFCSKVFVNLNYLGIRCWDQFVFWNAVPRITILKFHQFPLWNPYVNGGNVLLAHPHSPFLSPFYLFVLIFGPVIGLKLQLFVHFLIGMLGMYLLGRSHYFTKCSGFLIAILYIGSSIYFLHMAEGHTEWFSMAFAPWLIHCYLKSFDKKYYIIGGIIFLSLIFLGGSVDVFTTLFALMLFFAFLKSIQDKNIRPLKILFYIYVGTFLLCAIKAIPMFEFITNYPRFSDSDDHIRFSTILSMLLDKNQARYYALGKQNLTEIFGVKFRWHEYGAYIGIIPLMLIVIGCFREFKNYWIMIFTSLMSLFFVLGPSSPVNIWSLLHRMPVYDNLKVQSRFIVGFIFFSSIPAAAFFSRIQKYCIKRKGLLRAFPYIILAFIFFDLWLTNAPLLNNVSVLPPLRIDRNISFMQKYRKVNFFKENNSNSSLYPILLSNAGILEGEEVMSIPRGNVFIASEEGYRGEAYLYNNNGRAAIRYFSPNRIVVNVDVKDPDILIINQNFHVGWKVNINGSIHRAQGYRGLISFPVSKAAKKIEFFFLTDSFVVGATVTGLFIILIVLRAKRFLNGQ